VGGQRLRKAKWHSVAAGFAAPALLTNHIIALVDIFSV